MDVFDGLILYKNTQKEKMRNPFPTSLYVKCES